FLILSSCEEERTYETMSDAEGNVYRIKPYNDVVWMIDNLRSTKTKGGQSIRFYNVNKNPNLFAQYGLLYDYATACNICPTGWEIPNNNDWDKLIQGSGAEKSADVFKSKSAWNGEANSNAYEFDVHPTGFGNNRDLPNEFNKKALFWSKSYEGTLAWSYIFEAGSNEIRNAEQHMHYAFSVRCIKRL
ncbi:MAG: FISUMP domain-containing protein, partial [Bacteroidota bacterium]